MNFEKIEKKIALAAGKINKTWPLYSFVTTNPLSAYENLPFDEAVKQAKRLFGGNGYPSVSFYHQAWHKGEIEKDILIDLLQKNLMFQQPEYYLKELESWESRKEQLKSPNHQLDRLVIKWLSAFLDEGISEWGMPEREKGFYQAWRLLAPYDKEIANSRSLKALPENSLQAIQSIIEGYSDDHWLDILTYHLYALPGWTGYIKYRMEANTEWQKKYPITIADYLAVRLNLAYSTGHPILPLHKEEDHGPAQNLQKIWLQAWEESYRKQLAKCITTSASNLQSEENLPVPDAQMVFCIDTRSELIRRHVEQHGNYETFGYAGFFGIAMDYQNYDSEVYHKSCPPMADSAYIVKEKPLQGKNNCSQKFEKDKALRKSWKTVIGNLKKNIPSSFGFVEGAGPFYGVSLFSRTLFLSPLLKLKDKLKRNKEGFEHFCEPELQSLNSSKDSSHDHHEVPLNEKVAIAKSAFDLLGWKEFAPLVVFIGHRSHTTNNPFGASLDCGACAGSPGRQNARVLAGLCNRADVRMALMDLYSINIPADTVFIGGEHNTTTDEIVLFDDHVPETHSEKLKNLKSSLKEAQKTATKERLGVSSEKADSTAVAKIKANDWAETRPEWGLATNSAFIIGSRNLTKKVNLEGRCFLHSYEWSLDEDGKALEGIMNGPMVVTQWINNHYYFTTVDNDKFGSGSKITHNITGKFGVVQGNGGDLKVGLPLQSLRKDDENFYHQPLRLTVVIYAPLLQIDAILNNNKHLKQMFENEWIFLMAMDPLEENSIYSFKKGEWKAEIKHAKDSEVYEETNEQVGSGYLPLEG